MNGQRLAKLRGALDKKKVDALLITSIDNVRYMTGFTGSTAAAIVTQDRSIILVDPRYTLQATQETKDFEVWQYMAKPTIDAAGEVIDELSPARLGFEADDLTVEQHKALRRAVKKEVKLVPTTGIVATLRYVKDADEIARIRKAVEIADRTFDHIRSFIKVGMTEREVALEIDTHMRRLGADAAGFETIVAAGPHSAFPHAQPGDAKLKNGQFLKMDYGARLNQYNSDITRTVVLGKATAKMKDIYDTVLEAQVSAIEAIKPGLTGQEIDAVARNIITSKGYGENFGHGLGHSLGRAVHDGPGLSKMSTVILEPGMVMTVEPGIYVECCSANHESTKG